MMYEHGRVESLAQQSRLITAEYFENIIMTKNIIPVKLSCNRVEKKVMELSNETDGTTGPAELFRRHY